MQISPYGLVHGYVLKRGHKGHFFAWKQKNAKMAAILE